MIILMLIAVIAVLVLCELYLKKALWRILVVTFIFLTSVFCSMKIGMEIGDATARNIITGNVDSLLKILKRGEDSKADIQGDYLNILTTRLPSALMNNREMVELLNELENVNSQPTRRQP